MAALADASHSHPSGLRWPVVSRATGVVLLLALAVGARVVSAQWVGDGAPVSVGPGNQEWPSAMAGPQGSFLAWSDLRSGNADVYALRLTPAGEPVVGWPAGGLPLRAGPGDQYPFGIADDGAGGALVVWVEEAGSLASMQAAPSVAARPAYPFGPGGVFVERVTPLGAPSAGWPTDGVRLSSPTRRAMSPILVPDGSGGAIVLWFDMDSLGHNAVAMAQRVGPDGTLRWADGGIRITDSTREQYPNAVSDGMGGVIVAWTDGTISISTETDLYYQAIDSTGARRWGASGRPLCTAPGSQFGTALASDGAGGAFAAWGDSRAYPNIERDIYAQHILATGDLAPGWPQQGAPVCVAPGQQGVGGVLTDGMGGCIVAWDDRRNLVDYDIYCQRLDASGVPYWTPNGVVVCTARYSQGTRAIASDGAGGAVIVWEDARRGTTEFGPRDIYAQRVSPTGVPQWTSDGVAVCTADGDQYGIALGGSGTAIVVAWTDERSGSGTDIYAQLLQGDGPVPVLASFVRSEYDGVRLKLTWHVGGTAVSEAAVERQGPDGAWIELGRVAIDGGGYLRWEDASVECGRTWRYRLRLGEEAVGETAVPLACPSLGLRVLGNPLTRAGAIPLRVQLLRGHGEGSLDMFDLAGRRLEHMVLPDDGSTAERSVAVCQSCRSGVYVIRLTQGPTVARALAVVAR
ncbi:MAG: hypothetical protein HZC42_06495 [Candidatus Eisenbacteria bacterium]|nr:hypothetical protein [Candidatus Eisenbacteria bacterium]